MSKLNGLLKQLHDDGVNEKRIAMVIAEITKAASVKLYTELIVSLDDGDRELLEEASDSDVQSEQVIDSLYKKYFNKNMEEAVDSFHDVYVDEFLKDYDPSKL